MTVQVKATALLAMCADKLERCVISVRGFGIVSSALGPQPAAWAYADTGDDAGHRRESPAAQRLQERDRAWATVLAGPPGCGKTIAAARYVADRGGSIISASSADRWPYVARAEIDPLLAARWLLVDDLGDETTRRGAEQLRTLVCERYHRGRSTLITTTLCGTTTSDDPKFGESIRGRYGDNTWSRLGPHFVGLGWQDDLRGGPEPSTRGLDRSRRIAAAGEALRPVAARGVDGPTATAKLEAFAEAVGVDLDGRKFLDAVAVETTRRAELADLAQLATERLAPAPSEASAPDLDSLAWLDNMEISL